MLFFTKLQNLVFRKSQNRSFYFSVIKMVRFLPQNDAIKIDEELFNDYKFSVDQLMELAGLSCASAIAKCYSIQKIEPKEILILCGPGNNGGDGLVCARHLQQFGYKTQIFYPKRTEKILYENLVHQATNSNVNFLNSLPSKIEVENQFSLIVDALFGFSFKPPVREAFKPLIDLLISTRLPIVSIDIPSGWDVEKGKPEEGGIDPEMLISLTAPKKCAENFRGKFHYLGGRFVPRKLALKYELDLPKYEGTECCVSLK